MAYISIYVNIKTNKHVPLDVCGFKYKQINIPKNIQIPKHAHIEI